MTKHKPIAHAVASKETALDAIAFAEDLFIKLYDQSNIFLFMNEIKTLIRIDYNSSNNV